ncbi:Viral movement protein [Parasponia andersonii]|uniref:Viral movement protein n=1 Tax=Parasponia andersonii TaxID=3476 RepID=A0A2P5DF55_PARAD|nr:Viral movement protein [Parasponia andersonii]
MSNPQAPVESSSSNHLISQLSLSPSPSLRKSSASKLEYLYELNYVSEESKITSENLPLINPYHAFTKPSSSFTQSIKSLIKPTPRSTKEYVQSTKFDQCEFPVTNKELYVTLQIPPEFPPQWIDQGFSHIHFGAIRLALTYHGRKGLPVCAKIALLDTRMLKYQHACIGIIETTLNAGTYIVTFYPNFCMSLKDKRLTDAFKVQLQIIGVEQDPQAMGATLHYQMVYRVQNHALDLALPTTSDALLVSVNSHHFYFVVYVFGMFEA